MEESYTKIDKNYLEAFNTGYTLSKETGLKADTLDKLKPEQLEKMKINKNRLATVKDGMKQYAKDKEYLRLKEIENQKKKEKAMNKSSKEKGFNR